MNVTSEISKKQDNAQDLIKLIGLMLMIGDHFGLFFFNDISLRIFGRAVMPIFCFFAGYNCRHVRYKLLIAGLFITCLWWLCFDMMLICFLINVFVGQLLLTSLDIKKFNMTYIIVGSVSIIMLTFIPWASIFNVTMSVEYSFLVVPFMINGAVARYDARYKWLLAINMVIYGFYSAQNFELDLNGTLLLTLILSCVWAALLINPKRAIKFRCSWISRRSLEIYWIHLTLFMLLYVFLTAYQTAI